MTGLEDREASVEREEHLAEAATRRTTARERRLNRRRESAKPQTFTLKLNLEGIGALVLDDVELEKLRQAILPTDLFEREVERIALEVVAKLLARER